MPGEPYKPAEIAIARATMRSALTLLTFGEREQAAVLLDRLGEDQLRFVRQAGDWIAHEAGELLKERKARGT